MNELDLYKFIKDEELEISWHGEDTLNLWLSPRDLKFFAELLDRCNADDGGLKCFMQDDGVINLNLVDVCDEYDIDPERIHAKD